MNKGSLEDWKNIITSGEINTDEEILSLVWSNEWDNETTIHIINAIIKEYIANEVNKVIFEELNKRI